MITLWQRMSDLYGHRWASSYGQSTRSRRESDGRDTEELTPTVLSWQRTLRGISIAELSRGMKACVEKGEEWPPSAPLFRERCRPHREPYERPEFQGRALPQLPASREFAQRQIGKIRNRMHDESD